MRGALLSRIIVLAIYLKCVFTLSSFAAEPVNARTHGIKKVLILRIDFSDFPGTPTNANGAVITDDYAAAVFNEPRGVSAFYEEVSYGKTMLQLAAPINGDSPDVSPVLRMPQTAAHYAVGGNAGRLPADARAEAIRSGIHIAAYDIHGIVSSSLSHLPGSRITWGGRADVNSDYFWINGAYNFHVIAHELGHSYGLRHANLWKVSDGDPISPEGVSQEYGDLFDIMGGGDGFDYHFSHHNKIVLGWITDNNIHVVTAPGIYRLFRFDHRDAQPRSTLALKVNSVDGWTYWIGYRVATTELNVLNRAYILKTQDQGDDWLNELHNTADLLDLTTPGFNPADATLPLGATFTDAAAQITIKPVGAGGAAPREYIDIEINLPPFKGTNVIVSTIAGSPRIPGSSNGPAAEARFLEPVGIFLDQQENLYIADRANHSIRLLTRDGQVSLILGRTVGSPGTELEFAL